MYTNTLEYQLELGLSNYKDISAIKDCILKRDNIISLMLYSAKNQYPKFCYYVFNDSNYYNCLSFIKSITNQMLKKKTLNRKNNDYKSALDIDEIDQKIINLSPSVITLSNNKDLNNICKFNITKNNNNNRKSIYSSTKSKTNSTDILQSDHYPHEYSKYCSICKETYLSYKKHILSNSHINTNKLYQNSYISLNNIFKDIKLNIGNNYGLNHSENQNLILNNKENTILYDNSKNNINFTIDIDNKNISNKNSCLYNKCLDVKDVNNCFLISKNNKDENYNTNYNNIDLLSDNINKDNDISRESNISIDLNDCEVINKNYNYTIKDVSIILNNGDIDIQNNISINLNDAEYNAKFENKNQIKKLNTNIKVLLNNDDINYTSKTSKETKLNIIANKKSNMEQSHVILNDDNSLISKNNYKTNRNNFCASKSTKASINSDNSKKKSILSKSNKLIKSLEFEDKNIFKGIQKNLIKFVTKNEESFSSLKGSFVLIDEINDFKSKHYISDILKNNNSNNNNEILGKKRHRSD